MAYKGKPVSQLDGSTFAHSNCAPAVTKKLMDLWTLGYWNPLVKALRIASGDTSDGVSFTDCETAAAKLSNQEVLLKHLYWAPVTVVDDMLEAGKEFGISILCSVTVNKPPYNTGTFIGRHAIAVLAKRTYTWTDSTGTHSQKQYLVMDPGKTTAKFVWWPASLLIKAALASGDGAGVHVIYGRDRTNVTRVAKATGAIRSAPAVLDDPSNKVGTILAGATYLIADTVDGGSYAQDTRTLTGWNKLGVGKFTVAKIR